MHPRLSAIFSRVAAGASQLFLVAFRSRRSPPAHVARPLVVATLQRRPSASQTPGRPAGPRFPGSPEIEAGPRSASGRERCAPSSPPEKRLPADAIHHLESTTFWLDWPLL